MSPDLAQEWNTLQNNIEQYEKGGLLVKLAGVVLCVVGLSLVPHAIVISMLIGVLWIQEGIFRTFQSRLVERILRIEQLIKQDTPTERAAYQLYSEWLASRAGTGGLIKEYALSMSRPTVAFPYVVLILINLASSI
ncbi:MAG TPA: hypothetical protein VIF82_15445 [Burkholderiaceae bacterium]|jgi:hypothetical protein